MNLVLFEAWFGRYSWLQSFVQAVALGKLGSCLNKVAYSYLGYVSKN